MPLPIPILRSQAVLGLRTKAPVRGFINNDCPRPCFLGQLGVLQELFREEKTAENGTNEKERRGVSCMPGNSFKMCMGNF